MPWTERLFTAALKHIDCLQTSSSTCTVLLQPHSYTPCGSLAVLHLRFRQFLILGWVFAYLMTAGRCDDHRFSFFSVLRASLGGKQVHGPEQWSVVWEGMICIIVAFVRGRLSMKCNCRYLWCTKGRICCMNSLFLFVTSVVFKWFKRNFRYRTLSRTTRNDLLAMLLQGLPSLG
jgi:hypothetical protein